MNAELNVESQRLLVDSLISGALADEGSAVELVETHVSWVLLTAECAWKIKKALKFPLPRFFDAGAAKILLFRGNSPQQSPRTWNLSRGSCPGGIAEGAQSGRRAGD